MPDGRVIVSLTGIELLDIERDIISHNMTAGIILFSKNFKPNNLLALQTLVSKIQYLAIQSGKINGLPIFIDQEGGYVQRFGRGFSALPAPDVFKTTYDFNSETGIALAQYYGKKLAEELHPFGIISLCPVLDLKAGNAIIQGLDRAFHSDPIACAILTEAFIDGMQQAGMLATGKHFPGHGQNIGDSHKVKPTDNRTLEEIEQQDLIPFLHNINKLAAIMPAHITFPEIDPEHTVSMSEIWLKELLRCKYKFDGVIVSNCLSMSGAGEGSYLAKTEQALRHGDIALLCNIDPTELLAVLNSLGERYFMDPGTETRFAKWVQPSRDIRCGLAMQYKTAIPDNPAPLLLSRGVEAKPGELQKFASGAKIEEVLPKASLTTLPGSKCIC
jgi:beta-N-acetylhexosaminidase